MKDPDILISTDQFAAAYTRLFLPDVAAVKQPKKKPQPRRPKK
jgi:hypothetical protein